MKKVYLMNTFIRHKDKNRQLISLGLNVTWLPLRCLVMYVYSVVSFHT